MERGALLSGLAERMGGAAPKAADAEPFERDLALVDRIAPSSVRFDGTRVCLNGRFRRYGGIRQFPRHNGNGWLDKVKRLPQPNICIQVAPADKGILESAANRTDSLASVKANRANSISAAVRSAEDQTEAAELMGMVTDRTKTFLSCAFTFSVEGDDDKALCAALNNAFGSRRHSQGGLEYDGLTEGQREAFLTCEPAANPDNPYLKPRFTVALEASALAAMAPFDTAGLMEPDGIELGTDGEGALVKVNMMKRTLTRPNFNLVIGGKSGNGKSHLLRTVAAGEYALGKARIFWLDFEQEARHLCRELGGKYLNCSGRGVSLSPLQYRTTSFDFNDDGDMDGLDPTVEVLRSTIQFLGGFYKLAFDISNDDMPYLYIGLERAYAAHGVGYETEADDIDMSDYPTMDEVADVFEALAEEEGMDFKQRIYTRLAAHTRTAGKNGLYGNFWGGRTDVALDSDFVVFDLSALASATECVKNAQLYNILSFVWGEICKSRATGTPLRLILDEAHMLLGSTTDGNGDKHMSSVSSALVSQIVRRARKYNAGVAIATQSLHEFDNGDAADMKAAKTIFENMTYSFVFGMDEWRLAADLLQLPAEKARELPRFRMGHCIFKSGAEEYTDLHVGRSDDLMPWFGNAGGR